MKKYFIGGLLPFLILFGLSYGLIKAADVEIILGTSSAFNVVRGTSVSLGTKMVYVGSATVSIGTTTQSAMLTVVGSSTDTTDGLRVTNSSGIVTLNVRNDGAVFIGTNTSSLNSALYVGSATSGSLGTITAGFLSMGTISANAGLHGTTTVRFLADIFANGTITASKFSGDGAGLTGITATGGVTGGNISTSGTISAGSTTVSTLTSTGSTTVTGTLTAGGGNFVIDNNANRAVIDFNTVGIGTNTPSSSYMLQVTDSSDLGVAVGSSGSITAKTLSVTGSATVTGTLTAGGSNFQVDNSISRAVIDFNTVGIGTNTPSSSYMLQVTDSSDPGVVVGSSGSITAKTITATGSATVTGTLTAGGTNFQVDNSISRAIIDFNTVGIGTNTPSSSYMLQVTDSSDPGVVVGSSGSITAKTITSTGSITVSSNGTITAGFLSVGTITANVTLHGTTTVHFPGGINVTGPKNFLIPHPDPQKRDMGWVLRHSCIESPTRGDTLYRYKVEIESDGGEAFIDLPSYWLYLNENSEVWVSPVGQFAQSYGYVDEVLNKLVLKGEKKGFYNVLLIGTRKDQYAKAFDAKGVEYIDPAINELLTHGEKKDAVDVQLIDAHSDRLIKNFMDPIVDRFGLATHQ